MKMGIINFIIEYWLLWIIGLMAFPVLILIIQLKNILFAFNNTTENPREVWRRFLSPFSLIVSVVLGIATFICMILFFASIISGLVLLVISK
ncbi:hypothetical protein ACFLZV_00485 [Candidatus Margulisiibacteriota bacterium]